MATRISASFWRRFMFWRPLYTARQVDGIIGTILAGTVDIDRVQKLFTEGDAFDAGAVDDALQAHLIRVFNRQITADKNADKEIVTRWREALRQGKV